MAAYRNRKIEREVLNFLQTLPVSLLKFPFDPMSAASTLKNCTVHSYQYFSKKYGESFEDIQLDCQSETGCTHNQNGNYTPSLKHFLINGYKTLKLM